MIECAGALGCLLYEMCALVPPFEATNHLALAVKINSGKFNRIPSQYSDDLYRAVRWMIQVDATKRPTVEDLERIPNLKPFMGDAMGSVKEYQAGHKYAARVKDVGAREESLAAREAAVAEREKALAEKEAQLAEREAAVAARERVLDRVPYSSSSTTMLPASSSSSSSSGYAQLPVTSSSSSSSGTVVPPALHRANSAPGNAFRVAPPALPRTGIENAQAGIFGKAGAHRRAVTGVAAFGTETPTAGSGI
jgi:serine/threonine protein kinase